MPDLDYNLFRRHSHDDIETDKLDYATSIKNGPTVPSLPISVSNGGTGLSTLTAHEVLVGNGTGTVTLITNSTAGFVLTSNGNADPSFQAIPNTGVSFKSFVPFELNTTRIDQNVNSSATITFGTGGMRLQTTTSTSSSAAADFEVANGNANFGVFSGSPTWGCTILCTTGTTYNMFAGLGYVSLPCDFVGQNHAGFKIVDGNLIATQSDGTTEAVSGTLTTIATGDTLEFYLKMNGSSSIDYYWAKNGGAMSAATNLATHMPTNHNPEYKFIAYFAVDQHSSGNNVESLWVQSGFYYR